MRKALTGRTGCRTNGAFRDLPAHNPERLLAAQKGGMFLLDKNVRLESRGVFVVDQKVADLGQVVEKIARVDIVEIRGPVKERGSKLVAGN